MLVPFLVGFSFYIQLAAQTTDLGLVLGEKYYSYQAAPIAEHSTPSDRLLWYRFDSSSSGTPYIVQLWPEGPQFNFVQPSIKLAQISPIAVNGINLIVLFFWSGSVLLLWRRFSQPEMRIIFLLSQFIAVTLLYPLAHYPIILPALLLLIFQSAGFFLIPPLLLHTFFTFPVYIGRPRTRSRGFTLLYTFSFAALLAWLFTGQRGWQLGAAYNFCVGSTAFCTLVYIYRQCASHDDRLRLRLLVSGTLVAGLPSLFFYLAPAALGLPVRMPEWLVGLFFLIGPITYLYATARYNLFGIDQLLNRTLVYVIISLGIIGFYLGPFLWLYRLRLEKITLQMLVISGLTLFVGWSFNWVKSRIQRLVDRLFYGGWYDYPGVVETISDALAGATERAQIYDVLTRRVPSMMQLTGCNLWIGEPGAAYPQTSPFLERFRFKFRSDVPAQWVVGAHFDGDDLSETDRRILKTLSHQAEIALKNVILIETLRHQLAEIKINQKILAGAQHQLLRSREEERARLARELHDSPIQTLVGLNIQLGLLASTEEQQIPIAGALSEMRVEIRQLLSELRQVCNELRPPILDTIGLGAALRAYAEEWSQQSGIEVELIIPANTTLRSLPPEVAVNLYRVVQESLVNIAKHAYARKVTISLIGDSGFLKIIIKDDGRGFNTPDTLHGFTSQNHFGLVGMRERVDLIGGEFLLQSTPNQGTIIEVSWPKLS